MSLRIENLSSSYGIAKVLHDVDLVVEEGEVVTLLGRNGVGKTTLVRSIAGTSPPTVKSGHVCWEGEDITHLESFEIAQRGVGFVPQGRHIFGSLTVEENLTVAARGGDDGGMWNLDAIFDFFPRLTERFKQRGGTLSGGEQQMLAIARALMTNPRLLLMDEPSEGLAPQILAQIRERIKDLRGEGLTVFLVEQNLGLALQLADRIYILGDGGTITWKGSPDELDADEEAQRRHLGV